MIGTKFAKTTALFLPALTCLLLAACDFSGKTMTEHLEAATALHSQGKSAEAVIELKNALQQEPNHAEARERLGRLHLETGEPAAALKEFERAIELGVEPLQLLLPITRANLMVGNYQTIADQAIAETVLDRKREKLSTAAEAELAALRGHAFLNLGNENGARASYAVALELAPGSAEALLGGSRLAVRSGDLERARSISQQIVDEHPGFAPGWSSLGDIARRKGDLASAEDLYTRALAVGDAGVSVLRARADVRMEQGNLDSAAEDIARLEEGDFDDPLASYLKGKLALYRDDMDAAKGSFQDTLNRLPDHLPSVLALGYVAFKQGNLEQAESMLRRFVNSDPQSDEAIRLLATTRLLRGDYEGAEQLLKPLLERNPGDTMALSLLSDVVLTQGRSEEGLAYLQKVVALQSDSAQAHLRLGRALVRSGEFEKGISALETATKLDPELDATLDAARYERILRHLNERNFHTAIAAAQALQAKRPDDPVPYNLEGLAYVGAGQLDEAKAAFRRALVLYPGHFAATQNLALTELSDGATEAALDIVTAALEENPDNLSLQFLAAEMEEQLSHPEKARRRLSDLVERYPEALPPRLGLARYLVRRNEPSIALEVLTEVRQRFTKDPQYLMALGAVQIGAGRHWDAVETLETAVVEAPRSAAMHVLLARARAETNDVAGTRSALARALDLEPRNLAAMAALTRLHLREGRHDEAAKLLALMEQEFPGRAETDVISARLALLRGQSREGIAAYRQALTKSPDNLPLLLELYNALGEHEGPRSAASLLDQWLETHPDNVNVQYTRGLAAMAMQDAEDAVAKFRKVLELQAEHAASLNNLAWLLRESDPEEALLLIERALAQEPANPDYLDTAGAILLERGDVEAAVERQRAALAQQPDSPRLAYRLAVALNEQGATAEARTVLTQLLEVRHRDFPEWARANALLEKLQTP